MNETPSESLLRTRYRDWCSAQIVERIDALSPSEVWERAEADALAAQPGPDYPRLVGRLTASLVGELDLPSFDEWLVRYRRDPRSIERDLIGFAPVDADADTRTEAAQPSDAAPAA